MKKYSNEESLHTSLFREVTKFQCQEQFHRIATGGSVLTDYHFIIEINSSDLPIKLTFDVIPLTKPSSNIHVLIGRNGIGKTNLIREVICNICGENTDRIKIKYDNQASDATFANALCVAFSPFDDYSKIIKLETSPHKDCPRCFYIGLDRNNNNLLKNIERQFLTNLKGCFSSGEKTKRWNKTMDILESDPMFEAINIGRLTDESYFKKDGTEEKSTLEKAEELFSLLSSGHKCVLSIITSCVNKLEEKSIIFIDEPENHLHPPLLASLLQALSFLLNDRNGVAIISTHSPVVLQEVPKSCVWILNRFGDEWSGKRPEFETFGADIGSLTREVFGLEILKSGYHKMIKDVVDHAESLEEVLETFEDNLGNEALGLAHILWTQNREEI
ncbi:AAA family ATPase [Agathobaculum sp. Marseille-P7918]|uniref:AAA family ATPase n=1 Tax=Agathobaculum sp. Marseille-P7918 TaxID=2479843 RepID=UPI0013DE4B0B|nr:AAA family ATPase [Agathobaculum sp. Marseille-P7918]